MFRPRGWNLSGWAGNFLLAWRRARGYKHATEPAKQGGQPGSVAPPLAAAVQTPREMTLMAKKSSPPKAKPAPEAQPSAAGAVRQALEAGEGLLRLAPTWVPRSFLMPGRRIKLAPQDLYALGALRGGIDERWFASTTPAANEGALP